VIFILNRLNIKSFFEKISNRVKLSALLSFIKKNKCNITLAGSSAICLTAFVLVVLLAGIRVGIKVSYSGKNIGVVANEQVGDKAIGIASETVSGGEAKEAIGSPSYSLTLTVSDKLDNAADLADTILENTADLTYGTALIINGKNVACVEDESINDYLEARRTAYYVKGAENSAEFADKVETESGYYLTKEFTDIKEAQEIIDSLKVKTVSTVKSEAVIPYKTVKKTTVKKTVGYSKVETKGENGLSVTTESVERVNGTIVSKKKISTKVEKKATDEVVIIGTGIKTVSASERASYASSGLICPIASGRYRISSYYGDGRNHKGLDLCADRGTPIFAAGGGVVTYAGYDSDFGYNVIVKHSNGISTRYAHASALCVKKGQVVAQGDMIAAVGSTGWSTGNHLHFEVIVNGVRVNPAPYIGL